MYGEATVRILTEVLPNAVCEQDYDEWARIAYRGALYAGHYGLIDWIGEELTRMRGEK